MFFLHETLFQTIKVYFIPLINFIKYPNVKYQMKYNIYITVFFLTNMYSEIKSS